jgi:lipid A ethanolaminephosphotransferase
VFGAQSPFHRGAHLRSAFPPHLAFSSETRFALVVSLIWAVVYNGAFWHQTFAAMWNGSTESTAFVLSLFLIVVSLQAVLLLLMPSQLLMRIASSILFPAAAITSYFCGAYGVYMTQDMLRNALETDAAEVGALITTRLIVEVLLLGVLPALLVWFVRLPAIPWTQRLKERAAWFGAAAIVCLAVLFAFSANYAVLFREHKPIRYTLLPAAPVTSLVGLMDSGRARAVDQPLLAYGGNAVRTWSPRSRPLVLFLVIGETARAENFQLGGYSRPTNPELGSLGNLLYFNASACATSTALSLPCMFSPFGRNGFDVDETRRYMNLLDALLQAGLDVEWRDNNSGCKGVCARVKQVDYSSRQDPQLCAGSGCYDEIMLIDLEARLRDVHRDTVIVFHQIGSHGPAYSRRYPESFRKFKPACHSSQLQTCSEQEIVNAYDNTIAYTDHVLARQIDLLRNASSRVDGLLIYVSDHGESLGENGLYLHGIPYSFAPKVQKTVPLLVWMSNAYERRAGLETDCLRSSAHRFVSHDNLYHTVLGATGVSNGAYQAQLDILAPCRNPAHRGAVGVARLLRLTSKPQ